MLWKWKTMNACYLLSDTIELLWNRIFLRRRHLYNLFSISFAPVLHEECQRFLFKVSKVYLCFLDAFYLIENTTSFREVSFRLLPHFPFHFGGKFQEELAQISAIIFKLQNIRYAVCLIQVTHQMQMKLSELSLYFFLCVIILDTRWKVHPSFPRRTRVFRIMKST